MTLAKATDQAIRDENRRFLNDAEAQAEARRLGDLYRRVHEAQAAGYVQLPYPQETLEEFCARAEVGATREP